MGPCLTVPMTHMIWDFEDVGRILRLGHGVSVSCGTGRVDCLDSISMAGNGFSTPLWMGYKSLEFEEFGFGSKALSLRFDEESIGRHYDLVDICTSDEGPGSTGHTNIENESTSKIRKLKDDDAAEAGTNTRRSEDGQE